MHVYTLIPTYAQSGRCLTIILQPWSCLGSRALAEITKMNVLEFLAIVNARGSPFFFLFYYEEIWGDENKGPNMMSPIGRRVAVLITEHVSAASIKNKEISLL